MDKQKRNLLFAVAISIVAMLILFYYRQLTTHKRMNDDKKWMAKIDFIKVGKEREVIEESMAKLLGSKNTYNVYSQFDETEKIYALDEDFDLVIWFEKGAPAFRSGDGVPYPPVDSRVVRYQIKSHQ